MGIDGLTISGNTLAIKINKMAHAESHKGLIWKVFGILTFITLVEVVLGIIKPSALHLSEILGTSPLNWIFLILTIVKAYYIAWFFMHLNEEKKWFRRSIIWTLVMFILYLSFYLLVEGGYAGGTFNGVFKSLTSFS